MVFAASSLGAHNRLRLVRRGVAFVVLGNHLYIPNFAMDLREHFRASRLQDSDRPTVDPLSLYAQFKDHSDERVAAAAEQLLERLPW